MSNQNEGEFSGVVFVNSGPSLEERVTALEKQLNDMQAAMSCDMEQIRLTSENMNKALQQQLKSIGTL